MSDFQQDYIRVVIKIYGLELDDDQIEHILATWLQKYDTTWILKAIIESLYRGRYKIVSVDHILRDWHRLGKPRYNFTPEYEREIIQNIPEPTPQQLAQLSLTVGGTSVEAPLGATGVAGAEELEETASIERDPIEDDPCTGESSVAKGLASKPIGSNCKHLNPEESEPFHYCHSIATNQAIDSHLLVAPASSGQSLATDKSIAAAAARSRAETWQIMRDIRSQNSTKDLGQDQIKDLSQNNAQENHHQLYPPSPIDLGTVPNIGQLGNPIPKGESKQIKNQLPKRKLYNILKAIVDPNHQQAAVQTETVDFPPLTTGNNALAHVAHFKVSIENASEEQHC